MSHRIYTTNSEAEYFTKNKRSKTQCSCGETSCIRLNDEKETIIVVCDECADNSSDSYTASQILTIRGNKLESSMDGTCFLYELDDREYVVLADNTIISREEDNMYGKDEAIFPY